MRASVLLLIPESLLKNSQGLPDQNEEEIEKKSEENEIEMNKKKMRKY